MACGRESDRCCVSVRTARFRRVRDGRDAGLRAAWPHGRARVRPSSSRRVRGSITNVELVLRAVARASSSRAAHDVRELLLERARQWGESTVLPYLEPYDADDGMWQFGVVARLQRITSPRKMLPDVLAALGTGPWDLHLGDEDVMANWAIWDERLGGSVVVEGINWLEVRFLHSADPKTTAARRPRGLPAGGRMVGAQFGAPTVASRRWHLVGAVGDEAVPTPPS